MKQKSTLFGILFALVLFWGHSTKAQNAIGNWAFHEILSAEGESLFPIAAQDSFFIFPNDSFAYQLQAKSLQAYGSYVLRNDSLHFHYSAPKDGLRSYAIHILNDSLLDIEEKECIIVLAVEIMIAALP